MNIPTICIDLGASYTKVGFRPECAPSIGAPFEREADVLNLDGSALIPSLAVQTKRSKQPWLFGSEAAQYRPTSGSTIHTNWKAGLYRPTNDGQAAHAAVIAEKFFRWLKRTLDPFVGDWALHRVRLTLPAFANGKNLEDIVHKCLGLADWTAGEIIITTEPHANAIGLMTVGRNVVTRGRKGVFIDFGRMFGQGNPYVHTARAATLGGGSKRLLRVAAIDIGAFTTDLAVMDFDVTTIDSSGDGLSSLAQESFAVGTHDHLDIPFWNALQSTHGDFVAQLTFAEREELKLRVFQGNEFAIPVAGSRRKFGTPSDHSSAIQTAAEFASEIWSAIKIKYTAFAPDVVYLTGGGSNIQIVATELRSHISNITNQPAITLAETTSDIGWQNWRRTGVGLDRLATAIGGVSVIAPMPLNKASIGIGPKLHAELKRAPERKAIRACSCHGNPDCPRCNGTGYIKAS